MATNMYNIDNVTYQAQRDTKWFTKAILGGKLVQGNYMTVLPNVKKNIYLNMIDLSASVLQKDSQDCAWSPKETVKLSEKLGEVANLKINMEDCVERFENIYIANLMKAGANETLDSLPANFTSSVMDEIATELSKEIDKLIMVGDTGISTDVKSLYDQLTAATDSVKVVGSTLTKANVLSEIEKVYAAIPEEVLNNGEDRIKLYVSYNTNRAIKMALASLNNQVVNVAFSINGDIIHYYGVEIVPVVGLNDSTMIAISIDNLILLTDLVSDYSMVEIGSFEKPNDDKFFVKGRMRLGVAVPFDNEAVIYYAA